MKKSILCLLTGLTAGTALASAPVEYSKTYDVVIYGDSWRAVSAAWTLLDREKSVLLVLPGGFAATETVTSLKNVLRRNISVNADRFLDHLQRAGAARGEYCDPSAVLIRVLRHLEKADILFHARPVSAVKKQDVLRGIVFTSKAQLIPVSAKAFIDASDSLELFRHTNPELRLETPSDSIFSFALVSERPLQWKVPETLSDRIRLVPSCRDSESFVEIRSGTRLNVPEIFKELRSAEPLLDSTMLSVMGMRPLHTGCTSLRGMPSTINLLATESPALCTWETSDEIPARRMKEGEELAEAVLAKLPGLPQAHPLVPEEIRVPVESAVADEECDVLICGGGTAGAPAAIAAARNGASVCLWEAGDCLGGIGSGGMLASYYYGIPGGLQDEIDRETAALSRLFLGKHAAQGSHPFAKMIVLERMAREVGVKLIFDAAVCSASVEGRERHLDSAVAATAQGLLRSRAQTFIDATGDADLAVLSGASYTTGRPIDAIQHIFSMPVLFLAKKKEETGSVNLLLSIYNIDAGYCDALNPWESSEARRRSILDFDRDFFHSDGRLLMFSNVIGARTGRQIHGDYRLHFADLIRGASFPDAIAYTAAHYDNHAQDYENESMDVLLWCWALDSYNELIGCEIPYRIMLPAGIENLLLACRAVSVDYDAQMLFRMQRDMQRIGEAAGIAAAFASRSGKTPRQINLEELQTKLRKSGALLTSGSSAWKPDSFFPDQHLFELTSNGFQASESFLSERKCDMNRGNPVSRYGAALKIATLKEDPAALALLTDCIRERCMEYPPKSWRFRSAPYWKIAIAVAGYRRYAPARLLLEALLKEKPAPDQQSLILAVRALERIGDPASIAPLEELLQRNDLPRHQEFPNWYAERPFVEDSFWKLELAVFQALCSFGISRPDIPAKYQTDSRSYVRTAFRP